MSFIAVQPSTAPSTITNESFWPDIDVADLRVTVRLDGTVTDERLQHAAINAMLQANADLAQWAAEQQGLGHATLLAVPAPTIQGKSRYHQLYLRAVYCQTRANLIERYTDFDSTGKGSKDSEELATTVTDLYRDARFAIRDILGVSHVTVELI